MFDFVNLQSPKNPVTEETISAVEQEYGIQFPPLLRQYYLEHNGQQIIPVSLLVDEEIREVRKISFLRLKAGYVWGCHICGNRSGARLRGRYARGL